MPVPFVLLVLSICAVWLPSLPVGSKYRVAPWCVVYVVAVLAALVEGYIRIPAIVSLIALLGLTWGVQHANRPALMWTLFGFVVLLSLALSLHKVPGFNNPIVIDGVRVSEAAQTYTQYLNFDKGSVGLILLAAFAPRVQRQDPLPRLAYETVLCLVLTAAAVFGVAAATGYVRVDPKLPEATLVFMATNLFLTCVAEEAFFRGLIQNRIQGVAAPLSRHSQATISRSRLITAIAVSAVLFGIAHAAGGVRLVVMATIAGIGYAVIFARTGRIESAVLVHFGVNAIHFLAFTYPALVR